jgi:hypothetical protein
MPGLAMHRLNGAPGEMISDEEIAHRRELMGFGRAAAAVLFGRELEPWEQAILDECACMVAPAYPPDGGLKPQVRAFEDTPSLTDVVSQEMRRRAQQQDPAHDQPAFKIAGKRADRIIIDDIQINGLHLADGPSEVDRTWFDKDLIPASVTGTMVVTFQDQKLLDRFLYGEPYPPAWQQNLMWMAHNLIAHPLSEVLHWVGYLHPKIRDFGLWLHDITVPRHEPNTGRG